MGNLDFLSKLVREHLPEGQVDSKEFLQEVIETYEGSPEEAMKLLSERIAVAERLATLSSHVDPDLLLTVIDSTDLKSGR